MKCDKCGGRVVWDDEITNGGWMNSTKCMSCGKRSSMAKNHVEHVDYRNELILKEALLFSEDDTDDTDDADDEFEDIDYDVDVTSEFGKPV